jgi:hypothetical protein
MVQFAETVLLKAPLPVMEVLCVPAFTCVDVGVEYVALDGVTLATPAVSVPPVYVTGVKLTAVTGILVLAKT